MVKRLQIPLEIVQQTRAQREELTSRLQEALEAAVFSNRFILPPRRLPQIAQAETDAFLDFLKTGDADKIRKQGAKRAEEGLGEQAMLRLGTTLRQFCRDYLADEVLRAADVYTNAFLEGFMEGREAIVLKEQEEIRRALQGTMSHYALQLATAIEVSRAASSILDPARLLPEVVNLICDRFSFYYVGLFLLDESGEYAVLRAGSGEAGRQMLEMGYKLEVGDTSMVGWCVAKAQARIALDVGREAVRFDNPLLPETRSEMALPLISQGRVIGAMTIQSEKPTAFSEGDIAILQTMADQLANAIQTANSIILRLDTQGRVTFFSEFAQKFFGYTEDEILGRNVIGTIVPERDTSGRDLAAMIQDIVQNPGRYTTNENENMRKNGERVWVAWTNKAILDDDGRVAEVLSIGTDITERKRAEEALAEERNLLRTIIDNLPDSIYAKDTRSRFVIGNIAVARLMGATTPDELLGKTDFDFYPRELATQYYADEQKVIRSAQPLVNREEPLMDQVTGKRGWLSTTKVPLRDSLGKITGIVGIGREITERKRAEAERERLLAALEHRSTQLQTAAEISKSASMILDPKELMNQAVNLIQERFNFYYVGLFLLDEADEYAVLQAGSGEAGQQMLKQGHKLKVSDMSMISWCITHGQARIALDTGKEAVRFDNPLLPETHSEMALPLTSRGWVIGAMTIQSEKPAAFSEEDIAVLQTMAEQLANAIQNARLFEEALARTREVTTLVETGRKLVSTLELDAVLDSIMDACFELFQVQQACFIMMDEDGYLRMRRHRGFSDEFVRSVVGRPGEGFYGKVYQSGEAILVRDARRQLDPATAEAVLREGITSFIHVPVRVKGETVAVLSVALSQEDRRFSERDMERLSAFTNQAAIAIENARLFEAEAQRRRETETLRQAAVALTSTLDLEKALDLVLEQLHRVVAYDSASIQLLRDGHLEIVGGRGFADPSSVIGLCFPVPADNPNTRVIEGGEPVILADAQAAHAPFREPPHDHIRSWLGVPMRFRDRTIGMIALDSKELGYFTADHARLAAAFASQATVAAENARLFEQTQAALAEVRRLAAIVENHPDFVGVGTLDGQVLYVNPAGLKMMGRPSDYDVTMMKVSDFYPAEDAQKLVKEGIPAALEEGSWSAEANLLKADGTTMPVEQTIGINYDAAGKPYSFSVTMRDISERRAAEEALRVSDERFALAVQGANEGLWDWDIQNNSLYWSPRLKELIGYADDELDVDFDVFESHLHPDDREHTGAAIEAHLKDGGLYDVEQRLRTKSGDYRWFLVRGQAIWDETGQPLRMVGSTTDITERKQAEAERERLLAEMAVLNEMGRALVTLLDVDAVIESLYQHASRLIDTTNFYVALYHPEQDEVSFPFYAEGDQIRRPERRRSGEGLTEYVIRTHEPLLIEESVATRLEELGIEMIGQEAHSWLGVPMVRGEQVIGVIAVQSYTTPRLYNEHHRDLLSAIANQAAIAIQNARLFQETQERIQTLSALHRAVQAVSAEFNLDTLTEKLIEEACCLVEADYGVLVTLDPVTGGIKRFKISGIEPDRCPLTQLPQGKGLLKLLLEGQTVRVDDIRQHPSYSGALPAGHLQIVSFLGLPLLYQDQVRGFLAVSNRATAPTFDQADEDLLGTFAAQATVTLENARLFQETQARAVREQILREITARVRGSTDPDTIVRTAVRELGIALGRPTFVRLGSAEQLLPTPVAQEGGDDGKGTAQQRQRPELVEGGE